MRRRAIASLMLAAAGLLALTVTGPARDSGAAPVSPTDETKVPHYFGPYPNWANSPLTVPDVAVDISGDGTGATASGVVSPSLQVEPGEVGLHALVSLTVAVLTTLPAATSAASSV